MTADLSTLFLAGGTLPAAERQALLRTALRLQRADREGHADQSLKGRHVAIARASRESRGARLLERAATVLGARVSRIDDDSIRLSADREQFAHLLGNLYDVIDCDALAPQRALHLQALAGIPVFDGLAGDAHPIRELLPALGDQVAGSAAAEDPRLVFLVQAALIEAIA